MAPCSLSKASRDIAVISLVARDGTLHLGVIYDITKDIMYHAVRGAGAYFAMANRGSFQPAFP